MCEVSTGQRAIHLRSRFSSLITVLGDLSSTIGILIAILSAIVSRNASEQHGFIRLTAFCRSSACT